MVMGLEFTRQTLCITIVVALVCIAVLLWDKGRKD